jgi:hypothetical protein
VVFSFTQRLELTPLKNLRRSFVYTKA